MLWYSRDALVSALAIQLPSWRCHVPRAGVVLWVELPGIGATRVVAHTLDAGLRLIPGPRFTADGTGDRWLRLPFTMPTNEVDLMLAVLKEAADRSASGVESPNGISSWIA